MTSPFPMYAAYNRWANEQLFAAASNLSAEDLARDTGAFFRSMMGTLNHILVADRIWMHRFTGVGEAPASLDTVLFEDLAGLRAARQTEDARIATWVDGLAAEQAEGSFTYVTATDRRTVTQRLAPALFHVFNHQTHHRGQAHMILTVLGEPSLALDLIYFQRTEEGRGFA